MSSEQYEPRSASRPRVSGSDDQTSASSVGAKTQEAAEQVKHVARERVEQVRKSVESAKTQAAERVRKFGSAVRWVGESLRHEDEAFVAGYADLASDRIARVAKYIDSAGPEDMVSDAHDFARNKPTWFFGGALLLGLGAGRFLKSSGAGTSSGHERSRVGTDPGHARQHDDGPRTSNEQHRDAHAHAHDGKNVPASSSPARPGSRGRRERDGGAST